MANAFVAKIQSLLGLSIYQTSPGYGPKIDDKSVEDARRAIGGELQQIPSTILRWYLADLEAAQFQADSGNLELVGQLYRAMRRDGVLMGLLNARTASLVRLPKRFFGKAQHVEALRAKNGTRSVFDELCPPNELAALAADMDVVGVCLAELVPVQGREYPVLKRYDPQWLQYIWAESRWYYITRVARIPITPGDGRWVMGFGNASSIAPWNWGLWAALGRAFILKEQALSLRGALLAGVANPAKVMQAPSGATEQQRRAMFQHVLKWGPNMAVELPVGWEMKLLEMKSETYKVFQDEIDTADRAYKLSLCGQEVTTDGGAGFQNSDVQQMIRGDITKASADNMAFMVNTQVIPVFIALRFGISDVDAGSGMEWDISTPKEGEATARMLNTLGTALAALKQVYPTMSMPEMAQRFGIPLGDNPSSSITGTSEDDIPIEEGEPESSTYPN